MMGLDFPIFHLRWSLFRGHVIFFWGDIGIFHSHGPLHLLRFSTWFQSTRTKRSSQTVRRCFPSTKIIATGKHWVQNQNKLETVVFFHCFSEPSYVKAHFRVSFTLPALVPAHSLAPLYPKRANCTFADRLECWKGKQHEFMNK